MSQQYDQFGDIINQGSGIFGATEPNIAGSAGGLSDHDSTKTQATPTGVAVEMQCRGCPRPLRLTVEYPELVAIKYTVLPQNLWRYIQSRGVTVSQYVTSPTNWDYSQEQQAYYPIQQCAGCRNLAGPLFTPEEAEVHLAKARRMGWTNTEGEKFLAGAAYELARSSGKSG